MTYRLLIVLFLVWGGATAWAQEAVTESTAAVTDAAAAPAASDTESTDDALDTNSGFASAAEKKTLAWSGFLEPDARLLYGETHGKWIDSSTPSARLELKVYPTDQVDGAVVGELNANYAAALTPSVAADLREIWVRFAEGPFSASLGKQIYNWSSILEFGVTDILNPQELPDLAQDAANRKIGVWSLRSVVDAGFMQVEGYAMPWFVPDDLPFDGPFAQSSGRLLALQRAAEADAKAGYFALVDANAKLSKQEAELGSAQRNLDQARKDLADKQKALTANITSLSQQLPAAANDTERAALYSQIADAQAALVALSEQRTALESQQADLAAQRSGVATARRVQDARMNSFRSSAEAALRTPIRRLPARDLTGTEGALRLYFPLDLGDFSVGIARLYDRVGTLSYFSAPTTGGTPSLVMTYPKLTAWTLTGAIPVSIFVIRFEGLYLHTADPNGRQAYVRNPTVQSAAQVEWAPDEHWQVRVGIQDEQILKIDNARERADEYSIPSPAGSVLLLLAPHIAHTAVTYRFGDAMHQLMAAYLVSYESNGHFVQPEADIAVVEGVRWKTGAQIFLGGNEKNGFGQLEDFSNVYTAMRVSF